MVHYINYVINEINYNTKGRSVWCVYVVITLILVFSYCFLRVSLAKTSINKLVYRQIE